MSSEPAASDRPSAEPPKMRPDSPGSISTSRASDRRGQGVSLIGVFLFMGVLAVAFAAAGPVIQRGDWREIARAYGGLFEATTGVCSLSGIFVGAVIGHRYRAGIVLPTNFAIAGFFLGGLVGAALWTAPPLAPVLIGSSFIVLYSALIRLRMRRRATTPPDPAASDPSAGDRV